VQHGARPKCASCQGRTAEYLLYRAGQHNQGLNYYRYRLMFRGRFSSGLKSAFRYGDQDWLFAMGSYSHLLCCESTSEERSAGNRHATLCGSRKRVTASDDPVGWPMGCRLPDREPLKVCNGDPLVLILLSARPVLPHIPRPKVQ